MRAKIDTFRINFYPTLVTLALNVAGGSHRAPKRIFVVLEA